MSALALWGLLASATAADWLTVQGTEPAHTEKAALRFNGFAQVSAEAIAARPVEGLTGDLAVYNGELATFNKVVGAQGPFKMSLRRIRVGVRGRIPQTDWISTSIAVEVGQNPLTTSGTDGWRPRLMDASITLESPAGIHLRMGQFKLPLADEATLEKYLQRCLFDDSVSLADMTSDPEVGPYLRSCRDESSGVWRFRQRTWLVFFGAADILARVGSFRRQRSSV